jgi:hypothetical protein
VSGEVASAAGVLAAAARTVLAVRFGLGFAGATRFLRGGCLSTDGFGVRARGAGAGVGAGGGVGCTKAGAGG